MREAWDRRPSPFAPAPDICTFHVTPEIGRLHVMTRGADCWCEPVIRWCEDGCCRVIQHAPEGLNA